ncbi:TPA: hypothetical protein ACX6O5_003445 [Photobacterium damselae]
MRIKLKDYNIPDQVSGAFVNLINKVREQNMLDSLANQDKAFELASEQIEKVRNFVGDPSAILGSEATKHGEIAEQVEVGIRNAKAALQGVDASHLPGDIESVARTGPADYLIDNIEVQSKFINGANNNLSHVLDHMNKYGNFGRDGSYYHIPKDTHELINKIISGENVDGVSQRTINAIKEKVHEIEQTTGQSFNTVVQPGVSTYAEVQQGRINDTLNRHELELNSENEKIKSEIESDHGPTISELGKASVIGAAVGGSIVFATGIYSKYKEGKNIFAGDFDTEDWKEIGLDTAKGATIGAISSASIYALTNYAAMSAPFASSVVSAVKGVGSLTKQYNMGNISKEEFLNLGMLVCAESAIVGLFTAAGQTLIPIPIVGAVIGSIAGKMLVEFAGSSQALKKEMNEKVARYTAKLDIASKQALTKINAEFDRLGELTKAAFDFENNLRGAVESSILLAEHYGVEDSKIIRNTNDLDNFMLS